MKIALLPSTNTAESRLQFATTYIVNDALAVDAGSLGVALDLDAQRKIERVLVSHTHIDHIATLPIFLENIEGGSPVTIYGSKEVLAGLSEHVFNGCLWPDLINATRDKPPKPFFYLKELKPYQPLEVAGVRITPVPVDHAVPTMGFILEERDAAVVLSSDTGPTEELWKAANALPRVSGVFLEVTFPDALGELAVISKHLTPRTFAAEVAKLPSTQNIKIVAVHIKPAFYERVVAELHAANIPGLEIGVPGKQYSF